MEDQSQPEDHPPQVPQPREPKKERKKTGTGDFLGGPVVKNLPVNAEDIGLIPDLGTKVPHTVGQRIQCTTTSEALEPRVHAPQQEQPPQ